MVIHLLVKHRCNCEVRRHFFSERVVNRWNMLDQVTVFAKSVNSFKSKLESERKRNMGLFLDWSLLDLVAVFHLWSSRNCELPSELDQPFNTVSQISSAQPITPIHFSRTCQFADTTLRGHSNAQTCLFVDKTFRWHANSRTGRFVERRFAYKQDYSRTAEMTDLQVLYETNFAYSMSKTKDAQGIAVVTRLFADRQFGDTTVIIIIIVC